MDTVTDTHTDFSIVPTKLAIDAMRDSGYKDTDHAIAELIDNSIEARADLIELIAVQTPPDPAVRYSRARVTEIAVADNGHGMDGVTLRRALRFGDGTRLGPRPRGIGRFGIGLPNASISQCQRVEIWTWQNGADNSLYCYLDLAEVNAGNDFVPAPIAQALPDHWRQVSSATSELTGTLVVWSELDRVRWRGGEKTLERTEELCGRVYRKFLTDQTQPVQIDLVLATNSGETLRRDRDPRTCRPNDPLYLTAPSSTPPPFRDQPMFRHFNERTWTVPIDDQHGSIHIRCTLARPDAINEQEATICWPRSFANPGNAPWGKHADRNKGVSIVRAGRELEMSQAWTNSYEPEERWWSAEVEFDPILDEIFGVVNNKQHAHGFVSGAGFKWKEEADDDETYGMFVERLQATGDLRYNLIEVWDWLDDQIGRMRQERKHIRRGTRSNGGSRHPTTREDIEDVATNIINKQAEGGITGESDTAPDISTAEKIEQLAESARQVHADPTTAREWAEATVGSGRRVLIKAVRLVDTHAFFSVQQVSDVIEVWLNEQHPVYDHFIAVLDGGSADQAQSFQGLEERLEKAAFTLRMLLIAWARHEDKAPTAMKESLKDFRMDWGREAWYFLDATEL